MSDHIVELQHKLQENRNRINSSTNNSNSTSSTEYKLKTAAVEEEKEKDVIELLNSGYNAGEASYILGIGLSELARIEERNQARCKFLMTGELDLPGESTGISIFH